jgi:molybdopterin/thiamine biosynthesis adenylyltransferase
VSAPFAAIAAPTCSAGERARASSRLPALVGAAPEATPERVGAALALLSLLVVGVGSVGMQLALLAARLGVGALWLVDPDVVEPVSLLTHPVGPEDVGRNKARVAGERCAAIHPGARVRVFEGPVEALDLFALRHATHVALAPDTLSCASETGARAQRLGIPLVQGAVHGGSLTATVRVLRRACPRCLFTARDEAELVLERRFKCTGDPEVRSRPTVAPAALCSLAASFQLLALLRLEVGAGSAEVDPIEDTVQEYGALAHRALSTRVEPRPDCPVEHARWELVELGAAPGAHTPRALFDAAGAAGTPLERISLAVEGLVFAEHGTCRCGRRIGVGRFVAPDGDAGLCADCGVRVPLGPLAAHGDVPGEVLREQLDTPLRSLGAGDPSSVRVCAGGSTVLLGAREGVEVRS